MTEEQKKSSYRNDLKRNNRPFIFIICLIIASALWLIRAMEKSYETTVLLPVRYTNIPKNNVLVNPPPSKLEVKIKAPGFTLIRHKIGLTITPISLNIRAFATLENGQLQATAFTILTDNFIPQITDQINQDIIVLDVSPDTLYIQFDFLREKEVPVISKININCRNQYFISDTIRITPSKVIVRGPISMIDTLTEISTSALNFNDLTTSTHNIVPLEKNNQLEYSAIKVNIEIPVAQFTEYNEMIAVNPNNVPEHLSLIIFPGKVNVSCLIAFDKYKEMTANDFIVGVDYNDITPTSKTLPLQVYKQPGFIKSLQIQPSQVEFIIKQK
jgi:hypothetical protein